jgi:actin-like ATPase involved in cell morphogenesis
MLKAALNIRCANAMFAPVGMFAPYCSTCLTACRNRHTQAMHTARVIQYSTRDILLQVRQIQECNNQSINQLILQVREILESNPDLDRTKLKELVTSNAELKDLYNARPELKDILQVSLSIAAIIIPFIWCQRGWCWAQSY